jgi:hypothetical protein
MGHPVVSVSIQGFALSLSSLTVHGCLLKLDRPGEYKAALVDARFPKRSDAKAAVCLQAMSEGIGDYIRSIASAVDNKITPGMRSFSSSLVFPALTSGLSKIDTSLRPHFEYDKERDGWHLSLDHLLQTFSDCQHAALGATLLVRLSTLPTSEQMRRYTVPSDYRSKADAKVAVICHAAEQGVVEFVRFRGGIPPGGYTSPYVLHTYNPEGSRKRKQPEPVGEAEQDRPVKKKRKKGKRRAEPAPPDGEGSCLTPVGQYPSIHPSSDQIRGISGPGDMGLSQSIPRDGLCDPSQQGVGGGSGAARPVVYDHRAPYNAHMYGSSYPAVLDPRFAGGGGLSSRAYGVNGAYDGGSHSVEALPPESGPPCSWPGASLRALRRPAEDAELEPGEVVSSAESEFSVGSSRNEDGEVPANNNNSTGRGSIDVEHDAGRSKGKGKGKETSPANTSTTSSRDGPGPMTTASHVKKLTGA